MALARLVAWHAGATIHGGAAAELHVIAGREGPVHAELTTGATVTTLEPRTGRSRADMLVAALARSGRPSLATAARSIDWRRHIRHLPPPDVVLVQGAGAWLLWQALRDAFPDGVRTVVHLHELEVALSRSVPTVEFGPFLGSADLVMAVCTPVADLARTAGVPDAKLALVPGTAEVPSEPSPEPRGIDPTVLGIGTPGWRKGTDRFVAVAQELGRTHAAASCRWIGGAPSGAEAWAVDADLAMTWDPPVADPWAACPGPAVLAVTSREDPLPLVALEAGARGVPVVATPTGGLPALLAEDRGLVVDGWDLPGFAAAVGSCLDHPAATERRVAALRAHVADHHAAAVVGPRWLAALLG